MSVQLRCKCQLTLHSIAIVDIDQVGTAPEAWWVEGVVTATTHREATQVVSIPISLTGVGGFSVAMRPCTISFHSLCEDVFVLLDILYGITTGGGWVGDVFPRECERAIQKKFSQFQSLEEACQMIGRH